MTAREIIKELGGVTAVSKQLGVPLTTVSSWCRFNHVPTWRQTKLLEIAIDKGVSLNTDDFPAPAERVAA